MTRLATHKLIVEQDGTVASRKVIPGLVGLFAKRFCWFELPTFTGPFRTFDILELEVDDLMDNDTYDTTRP